MYDRVPQLMHICDGGVFAPTLDTGRELNKVAYYLLHWLLLGNQLSKML